MDGRMLRSGELGMALWMCVSGQPSAFEDMDVMFVGRCLSGLCLMMCLLGFVYARAFSV